MTEHSEITKLRKALAFWEGVGIELTQIQILLDAYDERGEQLAQRNKQTEAAIRGAQIAPDKIG